MGANPAGAAVGDGRSIEVFTGSNLVGLTGYPAQTDVRVEVVRQGFVVGSAVKTTDAAGAIEMNHTGVTDCFDGPTTPDIAPGDTLRATILPDGPVDTSVVRGVYVDTFEVSASSIDVSGRVDLTGPAAVDPATDVLELRINKENPWDVNDREGREDRRVDVSGLVAADGTWSVTLDASSADIADVRAGNEHMLEWSAGTAGAEEELPPELTVWDETGGEAIDCPPLQEGPSAPRLVADQDTGEVGDHVTSRTTGLTFGGVTNEAGPGATVTLFADGAPVDEVTADGAGAYRFTGVSLPARDEPYGLHVRAQRDGAAFFESAERRVLVDNGVPSLRVRRFGPRRLRLLSRERVHTAVDLGEAAVVTARVERRPGDRLRTVKTFRVRRPDAAGRLVYRWAGRNHAGRHVRPGRYLLRLTATDEAGNAGTRTRGFRVVHADPPGRPVVRRATSGRRGGARTATARWTRPPSNNGSRVTGYRVRALRLSRRGVVVDRRASRMLPASARAHRMRLRPGRYRFRVKAVNTVGAGRWSLASSRVRSR